MDNPLIEIPDDLSEETQRLSPSHRAYAVARVYSEHYKNHAECARLAGYSTSSPEVLKATAWRLEQRTDIQNAVLAETRKLIRSHAPDCVRALSKIVCDPKAKQSDIIKASDSLLDRMGLGSVMRHEHDHTVTHKNTREQNLAEIRELLRLPEMQQFLRGDTEATRLLAEANVVDADFVEVASPQSEDDLADLFAPGGTND